MKAAHAIGGAAVALALAAPGRAQMIGDDLAATLEGLGCVAAESELSSAFLADGFHISDYQAQALALYRRSHLVPGEREGQLKLVNWGTCI